MNFPDFYGGTRERVKPRTNNNCSQLRSSLKIREQGNAAMIKGTLKRLYNKVQLYFSL